MWSCCGLWSWVDLSSGYSSSRLYKMFKGRKWKTHALKTALTVPVILFCIMFKLNARLREKNSSRAVPIGTMFELACTWLGMFVPYVFLGSYLGFKWPAGDDIIIIIPGEMIPEPHILTVLSSIVFGGIASFMCIFDELEMVMKAIWVDKVYNVFGFTWFLFEVYLCFIVLSAVSAILCCYNQLRFEDYNWWWTSYLTGGSSDLIIFFNSVVFFFKYLEIRDKVSVVLYFGCMLVASFASFMMMTGAVGFYACLWFVRKEFSTGIVN